MPKFVYIGGKTPSAAVDFEWRESPKEAYVVKTDGNGRPIQDERGEHAPDAPDKCFAFGMWWKQGQPVDVTPDKFDQRAHYDNAIIRLRQNRFFQEVAIEDAKFEEVVPERKSRRAVAAAE